MKRLILNRAKCNKCNDIVISHTRHDFKKCKCGAISVDGGIDYTKRSAKDFNDIKEMSVTTDAPFEIIRESLYRGTYGKNGKEEHKWILLKDMSNEHIQNCIIYNELYFMKSEDHVTDYYRQELEYRKENGIFIED